MFLQFGLLGFFVSLGKKVFFFLPALSAVKRGPKPGIHPVPICFPKKLHETLEFFSP